MCILTHNSGKKWWLTTVATITYRDGPDTTVSEVSQSGAITEASRDAWRDVRGHKTLPPLVCCPVGTAVWRARRRGPIPRRGHRQRHGDSGHHGTPPLLRAAVNANTAAWGECRVCLCVCISSNIPVFYTLIMYHCLSVITVYFFLSIFHLNILLLHLCKIYSFPSLLFYISFSYLVEEICWFYRFSAVGVLTWPPALTRRWLGWGSMTFIF